MSRVYSDTDDYSDHGPQPDFHIVPSSSSHYNRESRHSQDQYDDEEREELLKQPSHGEGTEGEEEEAEEELPPIEWHPAVVFLAKVVKTLFSPIFKLVFAPQAQRAMVKSFIIVIVVAWILLTSFTAYITFYQRYIPKNAHVEPIYFQYTESQPPQGHVYFSGPEPSLMMLRHEQAYDVSLHLYVPTSDINFNLGNFMVNVELETKNGTVLARSSRPAILRYQSNTQRILHVLAKALPLLVGWTEESQTIHVMLIENFIENQIAPLTQARVTLSTSKLQVYDAQISLVADFRGLRYYMYHKRITTAIIFIFLFTAIEVICAVGAWRVFGKNLWDKLHEAFSTDEITTGEEQQQQQEEEHVASQYNTEEENEDGYLTED